MRPRIAVIGGGISGLAAAQRIREIDPRIDVVLLESTGRLGGVLETSRQDGFLVEAAADNFLTTAPGTLEWCERIGFAEELISPNEAHRRTFIVHQGRLQALPDGFQVMAPSRLWPMLTTPLLSWRGKLRVAAEAFRWRKCVAEDESVEVFVNRHFGEEVYDRLVQPLVTGIYGADPSQLSVRSTLPRFAEMADRHRSLLRGMWADRRRATNGVAGGRGRGGPFVAPREGMSSFVEATSRRLPPQAIQFRSPVQEIVPSVDRGWRLTIGGERRTTLEADGLIIATPVRPAVQLLSEVSPAAAAQLAQIRCTSSAVVSLGYREEQIGHPLNGFGFVVPLIERRCILSCSFTSSKYPGRAPAGAVLLRVFVGGGCQPLLSGLPDEELLELAHREVSQLVNIRGEPIMRHLKRHQAAMPRYDVGHAQRIRDIERHLARFSSLALAGNVICGVGIPSCIQSGQRAAERVAAVACRRDVKREPIAVPI